MSQHAISNTRSAFGQPAVSCDRKHEDMDEDSEGGGVELQAPVQDNAIPVRLARKMKRKQAKKEKWKGIKAQWAADAESKKAAQPSVAE
ncbi:hypothetical protein NPX13_g734 [Xylaria arbuscula]|uniref:Uncharacterized protein n=1 Tax=Xylaria arbuscula TaxID=114810 RepID=A0A9W8TQV0_9PEZI|nr:hypothetical protein NPX13_g734 [Xylaria arbuscula]